LEDYEFLRSPHQTPEKEGTTRRAMTTPTSRPVSMISRNYNHQPRDRCAPPLVVVHALIVVPEILIQFVVAIHTRRFQIVSE
jgi:hypothetical protein